MIFNLPSRIILNILFKDIISFLCQLFHIDHVAVSPVLTGSAEKHTIKHELILKTAYHEYHIYIDSSSFNQQENKHFQSFLKNSLSRLSMISRILLKKEFLTQLAQSPGTIDLNQQYCEIILEMPSVGENCHVSLLIPVTFLKLISPEIMDSVSPADIEDAITAHFKNPGWILPDLESLIVSLNEKELSQLFNMLQKNNLLSIYQIFLLITAFPQYSLKIKNSLSHNTVQDVLAFKKYSHTMKINRRDLAGGIYSIEESLYQLMKNDNNEIFSYSRFLSDIKNFVKNILNSELLLSKDFSSWLEEMVNNNLLYKTISVTHEETTARAFSQGYAIYKELLLNHISEKKINQTLPSQNTSLSLAIKREDLIHPFISGNKYRKLKFKRLKSNYDSLDYMITRFMNKSDYMYLLLSAGWFVLSTALKGVKKSNAQVVIKNLPRSAQYLIEDVLKGIINPNILQDEMQINKAKEICVKEIQILHDEGFILLSD